MGCRLHERIPGSATVVDFSRPPIRPQDIRQKVVMGNRVQRQGIRFLMKLPGGWKGHELPACSMPSLVAALSGVMIASREQFLEIAEGLTFCTGLEERRTQLGWLRSNRWLGALDVQKTTVYDGRISCDVLPFL